MTDFIDRARAKASSAQEHIGRLSTKEDRWTMSVPPRDDDSDILLTQVAQDAEAAVEALARVRELHRPVHPVFNWQTGLRYEDPCETCWGKAGVHECGCWSDEDTEYECRGCAAPRAGRRHTPVLWPCDTYKATEVES